MYSMIPPEQKVPDLMYRRFSTNVGSILRYIRSKTADRPLVYHYTTGTGLKGVAESKTIWATHIGFMNDTEEYREAARVLSYMAEERSRNVRSELAGRALMKLATETNSIRADNFFPWFVACFSECKDDLAQWRGYTAGESKFALGMELNHLGALVSDLGDPKRGTYYSIFLAPAIYDLNEKKKLAGMVLDFIIDQFPKDAVEMAPNDIDKFAVDWLGNYLTLATMIAPVMKNSAFAQEREWRLIAMPIKRSEIKYRNRGSLLTPYIEINLSGIVHHSGGKEWPLPLRECWVGPSPHGDSNRFSARNMLGVNGFYGVDMLLSQAPYREL
jgi:hypothetical protein